MYGNDLRTSAATNDLLPISPAERIRSIDVLRGLAMLGVLIAYAVWNLGRPPVADLTSADQILQLALGVIVDTKAYTLLAFLFGVGFSIQMGRAEAGGTSIVPVYVRRLLALMAIGLTHALLLRSGDILLPYAAMGFVLLLFRNASDRTLIIAAVVSSFITLAAEFAWEGLGIPYPDRPATDGMSHFASNLLWVKYRYSTAITLWPDSLPMFFAGLYVGRRRLLESVRAHRNALLSLAIGGLILGSLIFVGMEWLVSSINPGSASPLTGVLIVYGAHLHAWSFAAAYASTVLLLLQRAFWQRLLSPLASVGRMALTNYLMQAAIIIPVCMAFDLFDRVTPTFGLLMAGLLWAVQVPLSVVWLKHFRFGPAEWLWRSLTYWRPQPMRCAVVTRIPHVSALQPVEWIERDSLHARGLQAVAEISVARDLNVSPGESR